MGGINLISYFHMYFKVPRIRLAHMLKTSSFRGQIVRGLTGVGALKLYQMIAALATSVILARSLEPAGFGLYNFIVSLIALASLLSYVGLPPLLIREIAFYDSRNEGQHVVALVGWAKRLALLIATAVLSILAAVALWQTDWTVGDKWLLLLLASPAIPLLALANLHKSSLQGLRKVLFANLPDMMVRPSVFLFIVLILWFFHNLTPLDVLLAQLVAIGSAFVAATILFHRVTPHDTGIRESQIWSTRWARSLVPFSGIGAVSYLNRDMFIPAIGLLTNDIEVAYFRVALSLALLVSLPLTIIESVIHPHVSRMYASAESTRLKKLVLWSGAAALMISFPVVLSVIVWGREIVGLVYGSEYAGAYWPLVVLASAFLVVNVIGPSMLLLHATDYEKDALVISVVSAIGVCILSLSLIPAYGAVGGSVAFATGKVARAACFSAWAGVKLKMFFKPE